jgi:Domain of unknown function (DUF4386)
MTAPEAQRYARIAGILLLISLVAGGFGESYVPGKLLAATDLAETGRNIAASLGLIRASFAAYLIEAACDLALTAIFYVLLRPVSRPLSIIALCFGLFSTITFAVGEIFYFTASLPYTDADIIKVFSPEARQTISYLGLTLYGYIFALFTGFYGIAVMLRGYLIYRSGYLPRALGALVMLGGAGFLTKNILFLLAPQHDSMLFVLPMLLAMLSMAVWFLIKGINAAAWPPPTNS